MTQLNSKTNILKENSVKKILLVLFVLFCFASCENTDDGTKSRLPALTTEGKNTFGCKIDGQIFIPKKQLYGWHSPVPVLEVVYAYDAYYFNGYYLAIRANNELLQKYITIEWTGGENPLVEGATYPISVNEANSMHGLYEHAEETVYNSEGIGYYKSHSFSTDSDYVGALEIIKVDTNKKIISGQFWFQGKEFNKDSIAIITDGRFDIKYTTSY